jgi:hypothetical protein
LAAAGAKPHLKPPSERILRLEEKQCPISARLRNEPAPSDALGSMLIQNRYAFASAEGG